MIIFEKMALLNSIALFADLSTEQLHLLAEIMVEEHYQKNEEVFSKGSMGGYLYLIASGQVKINDDIIHADNIIGEISLFTGSTHQTTATCIEKSMLLVLSIEELEPLILNHPSIAMNLLKSLAQQVQKNYTLGV